MVVADCDYDPTPGTLDLNHDQQHDQSCMGSKKYRNSLTFLSNLRDSQTTERHTGKNITISIQQR